MAIRNVNAMMTDTGASKKSMQTSAIKNLTSKMNQYDQAVAARNNYDAGLRQQLSSGSGSSGSSSSSKSSYSYSAPVAQVDYSAQLADMYARQQAEAARLAAEQRARAEKAYNVAKGNLNNAWNSQKTSLSDNLASTLGQLKNSYDYSNERVNADAEKSLKEAYINHMMNRKNINQNLSARGISGGATESTMAGMYNNYGSSRNDINTTLNENLANLLNTYNANQAAAQQEYNSAYANAYSNYMSTLSQMEQNLANSVVGSYNNEISALGNLNTGYAQALANLLAKQNEYTYNPTTNTLGVDSVSTQSINNSGTVTDYAKYLASQMANEGQSAQQIIQTLKNQGLSLEQVYAAMGV